MTPGFCILHANRLEDLRTLLVDWLRRYPLAPLEPEVILVQNRGMAQWLKLALAEPEGHGIAASLAPTLPARFLWDAYRSVLGDDRVPEDAPFDREALTWRLLRHLPGPLAGELDETDVLSRYRMATRIADLFDQYQVYRADWLNDWSAGRDTAADQFPWQPALWRAVAAEIDPKRSRAAVHQAFLAALATDQRPTGLPRRVVVFGISSLPQQFIEALAALGRHCQVLLLAPNPCRHYWADIVEDRHFLGDIAQTRHSENINQNNPLLASWGKQGRDYLGLLYGYDQPETYQGNFQQIDLFTDPLAEGTPTLLKRVQHAVFDLKGTLPADAPVDGSMCFRTAHARQREVEVVLDHLKGMLEADDTLEARDIVVMTPDIERYAPHIDAVFRGQLPYTIADQRRRSEDAVLRTLDWLLALPHSRVGLSEVLNLLDVPAVRRRFNIRAQDVPQIQAWATQAGIRWGLNAQQRAHLGLPGIFAQNTWKSGLERMLLGYANGAAGPWADIEPMDEVGGLSAALVGPLMDLFTALEAAWQRLREAAPAETWNTVLRQLLAGFFTATDDEESLTLIRLEQALDRWSAHCADASLTEALPVEVVRAAWIGAVDDAGRSPRFLYGQVNFCTLMPMRAIPFRVVCLLGMNDREFPRTRIPQDYDLMAEQHRPGDRSRRDDDRYQFLEAVLAAREHLYISWIGQNVRDNSERAPSVLVSQLRDFIGEARAQALTTAHPLQPFSARYFDAASPLATYAVEWEPRTPGKHTAAPLAPRLPEMPIDLEALVRFMRQPVDLFFRERLGIVLPQELEVAPDHEPFAFDALESYALNQRLLEAALGDRGVEAEAASLVRTGELPPGWPGTTLLAQGREVVASVLAALDARGLVAVEDTLDIELEVAVGATTVRIVDGVRALYRDAGGALTRVRFSPNDIKGKPYRLVEAWTVHLACHAAGHTLRSLTVGPDAVVEFPPLAPDAAHTLLQTLLARWIQGLGEPLPVARKTTIRYLKDGHAAASVYEGGYGSEGERGESPWLQRTWPDYATLSAHPDFDTCARDLYGAMLEHLS